MIMAHYFVHLDLRDIIDSPPKLKAPKPILLCTRRAGLKNFHSTREKQLIRKIVKQKITVDCNLQFKKIRN